jgi:hypothetical protein
MQLDDEYQRLAMNAMCFAADQAQYSWQEAAMEFRRPSAVWRPSLSIDGNQWYALYGANLQDGVAGFGESPELAMYDFDKNWYAKLPSSESNSP